ncbi:type II toxin-antitoxin system RelE/ParE family toxin [Spirosoma pollinicola]|uniref:Type II toxin-antitoxin system RelE/ParE family toxin n=1 Tax=Spirosoma pollinicola TaxID=2057025 RepID=A0A2K8Z0S3_9BACT|nr:type II toxin-antitoxin system RelE/ParE family toxin [Spirosoma pollinicola]AUD03414.1 hypothetical protein CWM47_17180 [Spirosoma pollinicola]
MNPTDWELVFTDYFLEQVALIQEYTSQFSEKRGRQLTSALMNFVADRIPLNPYAFIEYEVLKTPDGSYRRAVFKNNYAIIYRIDESTLIFLDVYHTSRNKGSLDTDH